MKKAKLAPWHSRKEQFKYMNMFTNPALQIDMHWFSITSTSFHNHDYYEINLITKGSCLYRHENGSFHVEKGDLLITRPDTYHQIIPVTDSDYRLINVSITEKLFSEICNSFSAFFLDKIKTLCHKKVSTSAPVYNYLLNLIKSGALTETNEYNYSIILKNWVHSVLTFAHKVSPQDALPYPHWFQELLAELALPESLQQKLYDTTVMQKYSATTLNRYFKEFLNTTPNIYFTNLKLDYCTQLLKHTDYSISTIAQKTGFDSFSYFTRLFRKTYGVTPLQYRKNCKNDTNYTLPPPELISN